MGMRGRHLSPLVAIVALVAACGSAPESDSSVSSTSTALATVPEWESNGMVIHRSGGEPVICAGVVMTSLPPQCGGPEIVGLDWADVPWAEEAQGVRWGEMRLVGTFDGTRFTLARDPAPVRYRGYEEPFDTTPPCPEPGGGWVIVDPSTAQNEVAAVEYAQARESFLGNWTHRLPPGSEAYSVKVFTFAENVDEHRTRLGEIYGGPLCVAEAPYSYRELDAIRRQVREALVDDEARLAGIYAAAADGSGHFGGADTVDIIRARVEVLVFAAEPAAQEWLDARFGEGIVTISSQLQPYEG